MIQIIDKLITIMKKPQTIYNKGFTLIELMVVIGIISIISAVVLSSLTKAKAQAENTKQIADYRVVLNALLQFKQDNGYYPSDGATGSVTCIGNYSANGCIQANSTILNSPSMNTSLKKYLSSYSFLDKSVTIITSSPVFTSSNYKGFILQCISGSTQCDKAVLNFPALKNNNSCPKIMSDVLTSDNVITGIADYTWCEVELN